VQRAENGDCYQFPAVEREHKAFNRRERGEEPCKTLNLRVDLIDALHKQLADRDRVLTLI
jgi:hypothetical protein